MADNTILFAQAQLDAKIDSASCVLDLVDILKQFSLSSIKDFINGQIEQKTAEEVSEIYRATVSIQDIFDCDVLQYILSFDGIYHPKAVCKEWKLLSENNENIKMRKLYQSTIIPPTSAKTYIVHPKRRHLNAVEVNLGYKGPMSIEDALDECCSGDRLLIHDGNYNSENLFMDKSLHLIGMGKNVLFQHIGTNYPHLFELDSDCPRINLTFENLSFCLIGTKAAYDSHIFIFIDEEASDCNVELKNCRFVDMKGSVAIKNMSNSKIHISDCSFENGLCAIWQDLSNAEINVKRCLFKNCGSLPAKNSAGCHWHCIMIGPDAKGSNLICSGSTFEDNLTHPIVKDNGGTPQAIFKAVNSSDLYILKDNVIKGNNQINGQIFDANTIYQAYTN